MASLLLGGGTAPSTPAGAEPSQDAGGPVQVVGWAECDTRAGGWVVTWAIANLSGEDATVDALSDDLAEIRVGDVVPAREWIDGRQLTPRGTREVTLEATLRTSTADESDPLVVRAALDLAPCGPGGVPRTRPDRRAAAGDGAAQVRYYLDCDGVALVVVPAGDSEGSARLVPTTGEAVETQLRPAELSDVILFPAEPDLSVEVTADGNLVDTLPWQRPADCTGRGLLRAEVMIAIGVVVVVLLAAGGLILARNRRRSAP